MPSFFLGLILIQLFALTFPIFSFEGQPDHLAGGDHRDPRAMVLPIVTLTLLELAGYSRYMRSSALDKLAQDYIRRPGPRACRSGWCCRGTCSATPACR